MIEMKKEESRKNVDRCLKPESPQDELAQNVSKKIPFGRIICSNVQNLTRVFSHDSKFDFPASGN